MMATQTDPIKTTLSTATTTRGQTRRQITPINTTAHTRTILGRNYGQLLANPDITQLNPNTTPLKFNQAKGLKGRPSEKIAWATTILAHPDILIDYEEGLQDIEEEDQQPSKEQPPPTNKGKPPTPPTKDKEKMTPMDRQIPDPLKLMRQQQAAEAKRLAAEQRQRSGKLKKQAKLREEEAAEKNRQRGTPQNPP